MPVADGFADKLVLHNSFEHFEGTANTDLVTEAWRVLKPGGVVCIVPLFVSDRYVIMSDPLTDVAASSGTRAPKGSRFPDGTTASGASTTRRPWRRECWRRHESSGTR
jgi:hypothetical protein